MLANLRDALRWRGVSADPGAPGAVNHHNHTVTLRVGGAFVAVVEVMDHETAPVHETLTRGRLGVRPVGGRVLQFWARNIGEPCGFRGRVVEIIRWDDAHNDEHQTNTSEHSEVAE